jgi:PAS domain-containing protein
MPWRRKANTYAMPVSPVGNDLVIRAQAYRASLGLIGSGLFWLVSALSLMTTWMLVANWRHSRKRLQAQQALMSETNFRRAMENSMLTGMRAMDLQGRITYVNAAFCMMTGWSESELVGHRPLSVLARKRPRATQRPAGPGTRGQDQPGRHPGSRQAPRRRLV